MLPKRIPRPSWLARHLGDGYLIVVGGTALAIAAGLVYVLVRELAR